MKIRQGSLWGESFAGLFLGVFFEEKREKKINFCQLFHALKGQQYVYKSQPKTQEIKSISKEIRACHAHDTTSSLSSSKSNGAGVAELDNKRRAIKQKREITNKKGTARRKALCIHLYLFILVVFMGIFSTSAKSNNCSGRFVNPITDICWSCLFPISIGPVRLNIGGGRQDTDNPGMIPCFCPRPPIPFPVPGIPVGFWEPARLIDITRVPFCMVGMGGISFGGNSVGYGIHGSRGESRAQQSFYQVHWYVYPVIYWLELLVDFLCLERQSFDVAYLTEFDPLWNADELSFILNPEAILFGNPIAQAACAADCAAATAGFPLDTLFWCNGCQGSLYPFTGNNAAHNGGVQASLLMTGRMMAKLHRELLLWGTSGTTNAEICDKYPLPVIKKSQYKTQM